MADNDVIADNPSVTAGDTTTTAADTTTTSPSNNSPADNSTTNNNNTTNTTSNFKVPEEYKTAGWATKIDSEENLWKTLANAQNLIGKKTVNIPDFEKATPEELENYYSKVRPKDNNYGIEGKNEEEKNFFSKLYSDSGLSKKQADVISKGLEDYATKERTTLYNPESLEKSLVENFGSNFKEVTSKVRNFVKDNIGDEATKKMLEDFPNDLVVPVYKIIAKIMNDYGVKETGIKTGDKAGVASQSPEQRKEIFQQIEALSHRPHTQAERDALLSQLKY